MKALIQRVTEAHVEVAGTIIASVGLGVLVFLGFERGDDRDTAIRMIDRVMHYRLFSDRDGRLNLDVQAVSGGVIWVPQFTLVADTRQGNRANLNHGLPREPSARLFDQLLADASTRYAGSTAGAGRFGAHMSIHLVNEGPVTFLLTTNGIPNELK
ncbi:D-tyrosyl-tRNA(Tyr) deacylase [mine drainage metagenome]|uniref:D-tyrosyl-tRNA(Tyr) deacylase n=2 Tax=mine drainage metagenome TaxID=410659 RepID=T0YII7_9ZZZZ